MRSPVHSNDRAPSGTDSFPHPPTFENSVASNDQQKRAEKERLAAARTRWEYLAARARGLHCPEHRMTPWRVVVVGDRAEKLNLQIYGCCGKLGDVVTDMIRTDPSVSGPS